LGCDNISEYPISVDPSLAHFEFSIVGDASDKGFFTYKVGSKDRVISRPFTAIESIESSTYHELTTVHEVWTDESTLVEFAGQTVGHYTDNKAVCYIMLGGSRQQKLTMYIFLSLRKHNIVLSPVWISRESEIIMWADSGSRDLRSDDHSLDPVSFQFVEQRYGKFLVDCMASAPNATCTKFFLKIFLCGFIWSQSFCTGFEYGGFLFLFSFSL
jgi:hypothetical protein